ncbi:MAG: HD-GYP domain-containing protein [Syntrophomonas sp.]|uniref:HD-GYP domain-containing protein n=1 Tax=Syntrophomonas sp. TaxID=2053627 RepID=UPI00261A9132|nr:HD-GYP domain-containing protein [Syntrophomonas sp.]MDD4626462.1 HD-GYP domain-containing protein [Syntrophomonas sp.]
MKRVFMEELESGMVIARTIIGADGRALLTENTRLNETYIQRLQQLGISSLYIKDGLADIEIPEVISAQVLTAVSSNVNSMFKTFSSRKTLDISQLRKMISLLLEDIVTNRNVIIHLEDIRAYDDYLLFHSINVAVLSMMTGLSMEYPEAKLVDLGLGALLHDIGMIMIDSTIFKSAQERELTAEEREEIHKHAEIGFNILRTYREVPTKVAHIAYQHHERFDGSGYPRKLDKKQILEYASIVAIADVFDAVVSDRPFRRGYSSTEAMIIIRRLVNNYFDAEVVEAFATNIALYPIGCLVSLNTGHIAVVTSVTKVNSLSPVVYVILDHELNFIEKPFQINLQQIKGFKIKRRLSYEETELVRSRIASRKIKHQTESTKIDSEKSYAIL